MTCPTCNDDGRVHDMAGNDIGPCDCPATPSNPMVPNAPGWWLIDGVATCIVYRPGSGFFTNVTGLAVAGIRPERWNGRLFTRHDLDAARAEVRTVGYDMYAEIHLDPYGDSDCRCARCSVAIDLAQVARIAELEAKVDELASAVEIQEHITELRADEARRAALREAADEADEMAFAHGEYGCAALRDHARRLREKAEAAT